MRLGEVIHTISQDHARSSPHCFGALIGGMFIGVMLNMQGNQGTGCSSLQENKAVVSLRRNVGPLWPRF